MQYAPPLLDSKTKFVRAADIAARYSVTTASVYHWAKVGKIPSVKFAGTTRFDPEAVAAIIERKGVTAQ